MKRILVLIAGLSVVGCGAKVPPLSAESKSMVRKFDEHMAKHKTQLFDSLCKDVEKLHESSKISNEEFDALHRVCGPAKAGQWDRARAALDPLLKAVDEQK